MSGWWTANAIVAETPIFVAETPEERAIGNLLGVATQIGNVVPFLYKGLVSKARQSEVLAGSILACQAVAVAAALLTGLLWRSTIGQHSVWLVLCMVVSGGVGTLSNVTYWALASRYDGVHCTKAMSVGSTVGGLVSAWMAMAQQAGRNPRFGLTTFMLIVALVQSGFLVAFLVVLKKKKKKNPAAAAEDSDATAGAPSAANARATVGGGNDAMVRTASRAGLAVDLDAPLLDAQPELEPEPEPDITISKVLSNAILITMFAIYAQTYSLQTLQPFMVQGYTATCGAAGDGSDAGGGGGACACELNDDHSACAPVAGCSTSSSSSCEFIAPSGPSDDDLLRYMYLLQQLGDVAGRMATALPYEPGAAVVLMLIGFVFAVSVAFITAAAVPALVPTVLPGRWALVLPLLFFLYYFTRGYVVTVMYVLVKQKSGTQKEAESLSGSMGLCGQIGALLANAVLFIAVQLT